MYELVTIYQSVCRQLAAHLTFCPFAGFLLDIFPLSCTAFEGHVSFPENHFRHAHHDDRRHQTFAGCFLEVEETHW